MLRNYYILCIFSLVGKRVRDPFFFPKKNIISIKSQELSLLGIISGDQHRALLLFDGKTKEVGISDKVGKYTVEHIADDYVVLQCGTVKKKVRL